MVVKTRLRSDRVRQIPPTGFRWIDRRFVREFASALTGPQILLYYFLASVADARGLSFWADPTAARLLGMTTGILVGARDVLVARDLIAYRRPLYQVLSLPAAGCTIPATPVPRALPPAPAPVPAPPAHRRGRTLGGRELFVAALTAIRPESTGTR